MKTSKTIAEPLDTITLSDLNCASVSVRDGLGREYVNVPVDGDVSFCVAGALGAQTIFALDGDGKIIDSTAIRVDCQTAMQENTGVFRELLEMLHDTMYEGWHTGYTKTFRYHGKWYKYYVSWLRDHVHTLKGMKYFDDDIKTGIEIYSDTQRQDGMIWDKVKEICNSELQNWRDVVFAEGDFIRPMEGNPTRRLCRIPVENDVEWLFLEGIYYTWKACGDDEWMKGLLDKAIKAVRYSTSDVYRWSKSFQLLKRGYTIDTWDFQSQDDVKRSGTSMRVDPEKTEFSIFFGDNTGMAIGCEYLAEMLDVAGRSDDADEFRGIAKGLRERLNQVSWNGEFFTHMVPENPDAERDLGNTPTDRQVTLSNAYSLNREIGHDKAAAILRSYQKIRQEMPETSAGEFYNCYPPFEKGFNHNDWNYMNGGVSTICGGELAHGAFEHGFEDYGVDILKRLHDWAQRLGGYLHTCLKGKLPERVEQTFSFVDIREQANADFRNDTADDVIGWFNEGDLNDMYNMPLGRQSFHDIDFDIIDPKTNGHRGLISLSCKEPFASQAVVPVDQKAGSVYLLHATNGGGLIGWFTVNYEDGSHATQYVRTGDEINQWFMPAPHDPYVGGNGKKKQGNLRQAWNGANRTYENVGFSLYGWNNPNPDKTIRDITFVPAETGAIWQVMGVTLSDTAVQLPVTPISYGIPDMWGAAAVIYALIEGLAGIKDTGVAYSKALLAPRWTAAGVDEATMTAKYPASNGYLRYTYKKDGDTIHIETASTADSVDVKILLPDGKTAKAMTVNGKSVEATTERIEGSSYACTTLKGVDSYSVEVKCV